MPQKANLPNKPHTSARKEGAQETQDSDSQGSNRKIFTGQMPFHRNHKKVGVLGSPRDGKSIERVQFRTMNA